MKKTKVLHIITRFDKGGSAENTYLTIIGLNKKKYDVSLVIGESNLSFISPKQKEAGNKNIANLEKEGIKVININTLVRNISPLNDLKTFIKLFQVIKKERYKIVHTHTSKAGFIGRLAAFLANTKIIIHTPHGHVFKNYFGKLKTEIFIWIERLSSIITDKIITLTDTCKKEHIDFKIAGVKKFITIHSGIDEEPFNVDINPQKVKKELNIKDNHFVIGTIGRLVPIKGHIDLINSIKNVKLQIPNVTFLILGDGELKDYLISEAKRLNVLEDIIFLSWREDTAQILSIFDIFVLPSLNEGMGKVLVEAMMMQKPIIATKVGGVLDLVKHNENGLLIKPKHPTDISNAIINLLGDKQKRYEMAEQGKIMSKEYTAVLMIKKIEALYESFL